MQDDPFTLTVVSYNIKSGLYHPDALEAVARVIEALAPDLVALQEVDRGSKRTHGVDQAVWLAHRLGLHGVFGRAFNIVQLEEEAPLHPRLKAAKVDSPSPMFEGSDEYGNAVLSKWPIQRQVVCPLPMAVAWDRTVARWPPEPRSVLATSLQTPYGVIKFLSTHFGLQPDERLAQATALLDIVAAWAPEDPLVVGGDFNALPQSSEITCLRECLLDVADAGNLTGDHRLTFPSGPPGARTPDGWAGAIDYIFVRGLTVLDVCVAHDRTKASDHQPLVARLSWPVPS